MDLGWDEGTAARFAAYVEDLARCLGHQDRVDPFRRYCTGLLLPVDRKSVEPMAAQLRPDRAAAEHQALLHFVGQSPWDADGLLNAVRQAVLPRLTAASPVRAWIVDDTGFPKKGTHSVGVARQYCGQLGKKENCQVAVSLSVATEAASLPIAWRLYLPKVWADDLPRRAKAKVPTEVGLRTKPQIALAQIAAAQAAGVPAGVVLADAGYGHDSAFRDGVSALGLRYIVGVVSNLAVWRPEVTPRVPARSGPGKHPVRLRQPGDDAPVLAAEALARELPAEAWHTVTWRDGTNGPLEGRFAAVRTRPAQGDHRRGTPRPPHWLLIEWPPGEAEPSGFWLATLPETTPLAELVRQAKERWRIERDYQELKQELGLGHYEGRGWPGFHHHAALCVATYGFLVAERAAFPPSGPARARRRQTPGLPESDRPDGAAAATGTARSDLDRDPAPVRRTRAHPTASAMPRLSPVPTGHTVRAFTLVTQ